MRVVWLILGCFAVVALWGATAVANLVAGLALTPDPQLKPVFAAVSVAADVLKVAALFSVFAACASRRWVVAAIGVVIFGLSTVHSLRSTFSFLYEELQAASLTREAEGVASASAVTQLKAGASLLSWTTEVRTESKPKKQGTASAALGDFERTTRSIEKIRDRVLTTKHRSAEDPIAQALQLDHKKTSLYSALFLTLLLELGGSCGFYMLTRANTSKPPTVKIRAPVVNDNLPEPDLAPIKVSARPHTPRVCLPPAALPLTAREGGEVSAIALKAALEARGTLVSNRALGEWVRTAGYGRRTSNGRVLYTGCDLAA